MISMSFDLGTRPKELLGLNVGDVNFDEYGCVVTVGEHAKTGARTLRLIPSLPYLREWLESHPYRDNKEAALFIGLGRNQFGKRITPQTLRWAFKEAAKLAGVDRRVYTYLLRHASITREAGNGLGDQQLKVFYGWSPSSRMLEIYSHLSSEDVNKKRLEQAGVIKPKQKAHELKQRKCPRCGAENTPTADFCSKCASPLDESKFREMLSKDQEVKELETKLSAMEARETQTEKAALEEVRALRKVLEEKGLL
jgi:ribosomal protein L40E